MKNHDKDNFKANEAESQFELHVSGQLATLEFFREGDKIYLTHTETPEALRFLFCKQGFTFDAWQLNQTSPPSLKTSPRDASTPPRPPGASTP